MAGRKCTICDHPKRKDIDKLCVADGAVFRSIAKQFSLSNPALLRHINGGHIALKVSKAVKAHDIVEADNLLNEITEVEKITKQIIDSALSQKTTIETEKGKKTIDTPDHKTALKAIDTRGKQIELKGKILGAFRSDKESGQNKGSSESVVIYIPDNGRDK